MKIGFNMLLWSGKIGEEQFDLFPKFKELGYDGVELPLFEADAPHYEKVGQALKDNGLACTAVTVIPSVETNLASSDDAHRAAGLDYLKGILDSCAACGAETLLGPYYQPLGHFVDELGPVPGQEEKKRAAAVHHEAAAYAAERNVVCAIEYLNRFECYFLNTMAAAREYVGMVDHPNFGTMYDTFHANIEEKDPVGVIAPNIDVIKHVHISENDRGTPGKGHTPIKESIHELVKAGYDGWLTIEAFGNALPDLAAATRIWRDIFPSDEEVYTEGIACIKAALDSCS